MLMLITIYTDGASRGNPGKSASGYLVLDPDGRMLFEKSFYNGVRTNNEAEYLAVIGALESLAHELGYDNELELYSDSEIVMRQLGREYRVKSESLGKLNGEATKLLSKFISYKLHNVPREDPFISRVDKALNELLDKHA